MIVEKPNTIVARQKKTKTSHVVVTPTAETSKGKSRKKAKILEETPMRIGPRMRGHISNVTIESQSTSSKSSTKESLVQIILDNSPPHPKIANIHEKPNEECRVEVNENQNDSPIGKQGTSSCKDETFPIVNELIYSNTGLVPYNPTWLTNFLEQSWKEQRKKKTNYEEDRGSITLQKILFQLF